MKNILFSICILSVTLSCTKDKVNTSQENLKLSVENGKLSGVVTFKGTFGSTGQADSGSGIYAINETDIKQAQYYDIETVIGNYQRNKSDFLLSINNTIDPVRIKKVRDNFDTLSNFTGRYISSFQQIPGIVRAATDGTGNFSMSLRPGKYYILLVSGNLKSSNTAEFKGNIDYKTVDIKSAGEVFLIVNFEKHEPIWVSLMRDRSGC